MGNTGNSNTYPYGIQTTQTKDQIFNRVTGKVVAEFERFGVAATQKLNQLVAEYQKAGPAAKAAIVAPKVATHKAVAA